MQGPKIRSGVAEAEVPAWPSISFSKAFPAANGSPSQGDDLSGTAIVDARAPPPPRRVNSGINKRQRAKQRRPLSRGRASSRSQQTDHDDKSTVSSTADVLTNKSSLSRRRTRRNVHARDSWASGHASRARSLKRSLSYQANIDYDEFIACQKWLVSYSK